MTFAIVAGFIRAGSNIMLGFGIVLFANVLRHLYGSDAIFDLISYLGLGQVTVGAIYLVLTGGLVQNKAWGRIGLLVLVTLDLIGSMVIIVQLLDRASFGALVADILIITAVSRREVIQYCRRT